MNNIEKLSSYLKQAATIAKDKNGNDVKVGDKVKISVGTKEGIQKGIKLVKVVLPNNKIEISLLGSNSFILNSHEFELVKWVILKQ